MKARSFAIAAAPLLFGFLFSTDALAGNGPIVPPKISEGKFVYTAANCAPKGLSLPQQEALNGQLKNLHNPFYAIVLCDLPLLNSAQMTYARKNGFRGDSETLRIEVATAMLMEDWAAEQPNAYDARNSGVFVISFSPRKYAWHPALRAKSELGLGPRQQDPYTQQFVRAAKHRPADYGSGIANLATSYDEWYFDMTDPVRIAQRAENERRRQEQLRLQSAQSALDSEILRLSDLLSDKDYLPDEISSYNESLAEARRVRKENDPTKMQSEANELKSTVAVLDHYVDERKSEARIAMFLFFLKWLAVFATVGFTGFLILRRRNSQREVMGQWTELLSDWDMKVRNAHGRWSEHYLEREAIIGLDGVTGETKELWDQTTNRVDGLLVRIRAMQMHQAECEKIYKRGWYLNFGPYYEAINKFEQPFDFDTEKVNEADLFGNETVIFKVRPETFAAETAALFEASIEGWKKLQRAAEARLSEASLDFPHGNMDAIFEIAERNNIPDRWFNSHPLYGDDDSDNEFYSALDEIRTKDPLKYLERIEEAKKQERELLDLVERLEHMRVRVAKSRVTTPFEIDSTFVHPQDDPEATLEEARQLERKLEGLMASSSEGNVMTVAEMVINTYANVARQRAEILAAIDGANGSIETAKENGQLANRKKLAGEKRLQAAAKIHKNTGPAKNGLSIAVRFFRDGLELVEKAEAALDRSRHLDAQRLAERARSAFSASVKRSDDAVAHCDSLDRQRHDYEAKLASVEATHSSLVRKMRSCGSHARNLPPFTRPQSSGLVDYAALALLIDQQISGWRRSVRSSESAYEEERRQIRRAQERREREERERQERERRRRSSYYSSSSSYGGGFGGGGFGGSSGGFGGGGFGGSSGSF